MSIQSEIFSELRDWLLQQAVHEIELTDTVVDFGRKLNAAGIPVSRLNFGGLLLHPVLGALDYTWQAKSGLCQSQIVPRSAVHTSSFRNAPFFNMIGNAIPFERHQLAVGDAAKLYPLFKRLRGEGVTDYVALFISYGRNRPLDWAGLPPEVEGVVVSFSTQRSGGFTDQEVSDLRSLTLPIGLVVKAESERNLAETLLDTYLGALSGSNVLTGLMQRGDGRLIDCVLWRSDLRGSTSLVAELDIKSYFSIINDYFDCTAGAVLEQGGEVLKFIGDAVMAIFPFENGGGSPAETSRAAVAAAEEAFSRARLKNQQRAEQNLPVIEFGVGLHVGEVMYGNVGTERRLDLTVTGSAANEVERLESLCKNLSVPLVASEQFNTIYPIDLIPLGHQKVAGIERGLRAFTLPAFDIGRT